MLTLTIRISDQTSPVLLHLTQMLGRPRPITEAVAQATVVELQRHFLARNQEPNKRGWPSQNFWTREGRNKTAVADLQDSRAEVAVGSPAIAHKLTGGTIKPKRGKYLAIPITAEAYKAGSPREGGMSGLVFAGGYQGRTAFLGRRDGQFGSLTRHYLLVRSVTHAPDPRTLPEPQTLATAAEKAARTALRVILAQPTGNSATP